MSEQQKFERAARVFLARLLRRYGAEAGVQLRHVALELDALAADLRAEDGQTRPEVTRPTRVGK